MNRPYVHVNVAMSADGKIDTATRTGVSISSAADKRRVDELRASVDAVLVGGRTLLDEDPKLTVKSAGLRAERTRKGLPENPVKVGVVSQIPTSVRATHASPLLAHFLSAGPAQRLIFTTTRTAPEETARLRDAGAEVFVQDGERVHLVSMLASLHELGIHRLMVEGGGTLIAEFFRLGIVDELTIYIAPKIFGGATAPSPVDGSGFSLEQAPGLALTSAEMYDHEGGVVLRYLVGNH